MVCLIEVSVVPLYTQVGTCSCPLYRELQNLGHKVTRRLKTEAHRAFLLWKEVVSNIIKSIVVMGQQLHVNNEDRNKNSTLLCIVSYSLPYWNSGIDLSLWHN